MRNANINQPLPTVEEIRKLALVRLIDAKVSPENRYDYQSLQTAIANSLYRACSESEQQQDFLIAQAKITLFGLKIKDRPEIVSLETLPKPYDVVLEKLKYLGYQVSLTFTEYYPVLVIEW
jgi:hypothetical protein